MIYKEFLFFIFYLTLLVYIKENICLDAMNIDIFQKIGIYRF